MAELRVTSTGTIKLFESDDTSSVTIASPASLGGDRTITLPDANVDLTEVNTMPIANLDIDGGTDIGANIADSDLLIIDDGAGGTNRKTAASRLKTYVGAGAGAFDIANLDIDGGTDIGADIVDADLFVIDDGAGGTNRKTAASRLKTYIGGGGLVHISTTTASSSSGVNINGPFTTTYDHYLVTYTITFSSDGAKARVRFQNTSDAEQSDTYNQSSLRANNETAVNGFNSTSYFVLNDNGQSNFSTIPLTGHMYVSGPRVSDARCGFRNFATTSDAGREGGFEISAGHLNENTEISGIKIYPSGGNFASATIRVYGIVNS